MSAFFAMRVRGERREERGAKGEERENREIKQFFFKFDPTFDRSCLARVGRLEWVDHSNLRREKINQRPKLHKIKIMICYDPN